MMTPSAFGSRRNVDVEKPKLPLFFCLILSKKKKENKYNFDSSILNSSFTNNAFRSILLKNSYSLIININIKPIQYF